MADKVDSDIQTALQSQTVQSALEKNTGSLSDQAFQSFLTNAPIPRIFLDIPGAGQTINNNTTTDIVWGQASRTFDPYTMHLPANTTDITIPVAGFYCFFTNQQFSPAIQPQDSLLQFTSVNSKTYGAGLSLASVTAKWNTSTLGVHHNLTMNRFFDAGDSFKVQIFQNVGASATLANSNVCVLGGTWTAPFKQYVTGGGN